MSWAALERKVMGYRILEEAPDKDGGGSDPPKETPKEEPPKNMIPLEVLPEELRNRPAAEVKFLLNRMADTTANSSNQIRELQEQLRSLQEEMTRPEPDPDPYEDLSDEELLAKDARAGVMRVLKKTGLADQFDELRGGVDESTFTLVASQIPDFDEYEEDVKLILKNTRVPKTRANIVGAYTMAVGQRAIRDRQHADKLAGGTNDVLPDPKGGEDDYPELTGIEKDIFVTSGLSRKDWEALKGDDYIDKIKVPV